MSQLNSLNDLFESELKDMYSAEKQILAALPKMEQTATSEDLKKAFGNHLEETKGHVQRLEQACEILGFTPTGKACKAMEGIIEEGKEVLDQDGEPDVIDAALIAAAQRVEHYEIAVYGCLRTYAELLNQPEVENLLRQTLDEEAQADEILSGCAEDINQRALAGVS